MKKLILLSFCSVIISIVTAQDIILLKSGEEKKAKIIKVNPTSVEFKIFDNPDSPIYEEDKDNIEIIKYKNGKTETFKSQNTQTSLYSSFHGGQNNSQADSLLKIINAQLQDTTFKSKITDQFSQLIKNISELSQQQKSNQSSIIEEVTKLKDDLQKQKESLEKSNKQLTDSISRININIEFHNYMYP